MCQINVTKHSSAVELQKAKNDGFVESVMIGKFAVKPILHAMKSAATLSVGTNIKTMGYRVLTTRSGKYMSIRDLDAKSTIFIPREEVGRTITSLENVI